MRATRRCDHEEDLHQPAMRGRATNDVIAERKALIADAAVALQTDDIEVLDTYRGAYTDKHPLRLLAWALEKMAEADAIIFAPDWRDACGCRVEHLAAAEYGIPMIHAKGVIL